MKSIYITALIYIEALVKASVLFIRAMSEIVQLVCGF